MTITAYLEDPLTDATSTYLKYFNATNEDLQPLSNIMMTMWTNFAKSG